MDKIRDLLGIDDSPRLVSYPDELAITEVDRLEVHTAHIAADADDVIVIITMDQRAWTLVKTTLEPLRLTCDEQRAVTWVPVDHPAAPALDPNLGWIIPLSPATHAELSTLPDGPIETELESINVGVIVVKQA
ncbi:hypothetical protein QP027_03425 [Corynebacterium breve]|uniref:Uncharacterized protein n=1 Tax=Corynebacterium breve TaxID=3049799 RepID=A0ABY8VFP5_9CORY|nr:hypothetical protein [Corynebacterium breve]WIM68460.1 hypothetical protein QP027_03425 [Corynebacterium breve]